MSDVKKSYYAIIPANVRYDKELTPNAKLLYGEVTALCNEKGYCWASNSYFSDLYKVSKTSISKWINQLVDNGYLKSDIEYKDGTKEILHRYLRIVNDPIKEKLNTPIEEKLKDNNTSFNNTSNKRKKEGTKNSYESIINNFTDNEELRETLFEFIKMRKLNKKIMTDRALTNLITKLKGLSSDTDEQIKILNKSIESCWTSIYPLKEEVSSKGGNQNGADTKDDQYDLEKHGIGFSM